MTLAFFKYGLPVLLGYTLFIGISGHLNPFSRPFYTEERPSWFFGLWTGLVISLVLALTLHMAYGMPSAAASSLLLPSLSLIAILITPALIFFAIYNRKHKIASRQKDALLLTPDSDQLTHESLRQMQLTVDEHGNETLVWPYESALDDTAALPGDESPLNDTQSMEEACLSEEADVQPDEQLAQNSDIPIVKTPKIAQQHTSTHVGKHEYDHLSLSDTIIQENQMMDDELRDELARQTELREETEKHLRITRKALSVLEAETRHFSIDKADGIIALEEKLALSIESAAAFESDALREKVRRMELDQNVAELKQKMVKAKQEIRRGAAARARALSTANKSIAFARQCVQIRSRLESKLDEAQITIGNRQKTISSLLKALEKQKRKTQQEVSSVARQLVLQEKQIKTRKSLEGVARSVENKLSSRLVKKVAKAKPLTSDINEGKPGL